MENIQAGGVYIVAYKEGSIGPTEVESYKKELYELGVKTVWVNLLNRMCPASEQIEVERVG